MQRLQFQSKAQYYRDGEQNTKYFFNLAKSRYNNKVMFEIQNERDEIISDPMQILKVQSEFYQKLYTSNPEAKFTLINRGNKILTEAERNELDADITVDELKKAVDHFKVDKTPGVDRLSPALYQKFWEHLGEMLHSAYMESYKQERLFMSARHGILSLIPKKNRNMLLIKNWRPLTMLTVDYKILSKVLVKSCLAKIN